jgi:6-phosphogluconolactonase
MNLMTYSTAADVADAAAAFVVAQAHLAIARRGSFHLALAGGSTPETTYRQLAQPGRFPVDLIAATHLYWGDERAVPQDHADSNVRMARESLIVPLGFPTGNVHAPDGGAQDLVAEAQRYDALLRARLPMGTSGVPVFDLVMLGMGTDGHTASLFPGTRALEEAEHAFVVNEVPQLATRRLTLTFPALLAARVVVVLVAGASKAPVLAALRAGATEFPICRLGARQANTFWMADAAATGTGN